MTNRTEIISARLTYAEKEKLDTICAKSGLTTSSLVRKLLSGTKIKARPPDALKELYVEINRIGVNINQIARSFNAGMTDPDAAANQALFLLKKVYELMERAAGG